MPELAKHSNLYRFIGSGTASWGPLVEPPPIPRDRPAAGGLAAAPTSSSGDLEAQLKPTASFPTAKVVYESQQGAVLEPLQSASLEIASALRLITALLTGGR